MNYDCITTVCFTVFDPSTTLWSKYYYPHFTDEKMEAQRGSATYPRLTSWYVGDVVFVPRSVLYKPNPVLFPLYHVVFYQATGPLMSTEKRGRGILSKRSGESTMRRSSRNCLGVCGSKTTDVETQCELWQWCSYAQISLLLLIIEKKEPSSQ